jgi:hypothetical protein
LWLFVTIARIHQANLLFVVDFPFAKGLPGLVLKYCDITGDVIKFLNDRHQRLFKETHHSVKCAVTTGLIILLKATSYGGDSEVLHAVYAMDTHVWDFRELGKKLSRVLTRLKDDKEYSRMRHSNDPEALGACFKCELRNHYVSMPVPKKCNKKRKVAKARLLT